MTTLLSNIVKEHNRLTRSGKKPDSLFLSEQSKKKLAAQAAIAYDVSEESVSVEIFGMRIYAAEQYIGESFRIYCAPRFETEWGDY